MPSHADAAENRSLDEPLVKLRRLCLALPRASERLSHGEPTWFVDGKRTFLTLRGATAPQVLGSSPQAAPRVPEGAARAIECFWPRCGPDGVPLHNPGNYATGPRAPFSTTTPQPEHVWLVNAGGTATTSRPAHAALKARIVRNWDHPASDMDFARRRFFTMVRTGNAS